STPQAAGDETIVAMTSDDHEIQDEVRKIINSIDWEVEKPAESDQKSLIVNAIEKALLSIGKPDLLKAKERLLQDYKRTFADCYEEPEFLNRILKDIYGNSYTTIVDSIKKNLQDITPTKEVNNFLQVIAR
ncbi:MAG: hypothetical protein R3327_08495, partial [Nitrosopumilaceae archaeon]|nr:hypothetical protein [Nitrosopumilaceae archaeon]